MDLTPGSGETPVSPDDLSALAPSLRDELGPEELTKATIYDIEQAAQEAVSIHLIEEVVQGELGLDDLLSDAFVRDLHRRLYHIVWTWAGIYRRRELNIGVAPESIAVELRQSLDTIAHRWAHAPDWTPRQLGIAVHAETVRIHPFVDGNGRTTRLLADLVYLAAQNREDDAWQYDWHLDKARYIALLHEYDHHRDPRELAAFIDVRAI